MDDVPLLAADVIAALGLEPHPEGGFFRETFRATTVVEAAQGRRASATTIAFLLTAERPSRFHRLLSDELWVHRGGAPLELWLLEPDGGARSLNLGPVSGEAPLTTRPMARVPAYVWQAARVAPALGGPGGAAACSAPGWSLATCVVTPGFEYADFELGRRDVLNASWPRAAAVIAELS
jgi:predicted cupin superfamily sugar epimerase